MSGRSEWMQASLSDLYEFKNGVNADRQAYGRGIPFINVLEPIIFSHLKGHEISGRVDLPGAAVAAYEVRQGDLIFNRTSEIGDEVGLAATYLGTECVVFGGFVIRARPISKLIDSSFAAYAMRAPYVRAQIIAMGQGAVRANIGQDNLRRVELKFPPLPEQLAIATALADADALIDSLEQLLTKKRQIKQGAMQELLTGKRRLPGFAAPDRALSQGGPNDWVTAAIGDIAEVKTGPFGSALHERDYVQSGTPIITVEHLAERGIQGDGAPQVGDKDVSRLRAYKLEEGDIVFSRVGSIDRNARVSADEEGWLFSGRLLRLRPKTPEIDSRFLSFLFHGEPFRRQVERVAVGQTMASLNTKLLSSLEITVPVVGEQRAIADVLSAMDGEIKSLESRLTKARDLKQAMAQALLTGRIRLLEPTA